MRQLRWGMAVILAVSITTGGLAEEEEQSAPGGPEAAARERRGQRPRFERPGEAGAGALGGMLLGVLERSALRSRLGITEEAWTALKDAIQAQRAELESLHGRARKAAMEQVRLLTADSVDEADVMAAVEKIGALRTEIAKIHVRELLLIKQHLTPRQLEQIRTFIGRRRDRDADAREHEALRPGPGDDERPGRPRADGRPKRFARPAPEDRPPVYD